MVPTADGIRAALAGLSSRLEDEGCTIGNAASEIPDLSDLTQTFAGLLMSLMGADMPQDSYAAAAATKDKRGVEADSTTMSHRDWVWLDRHRLELSAQWRQTFERWDVVVCAVAPTTAFRHDDRPFDQRRIDVDGAAVRYEKTPFWAAPATPCGLPVTTIPLGQEALGLPVGAQVIGPRLEDYTTLLFAELLESTLGYGFTAPPGM